MGWKVLSSRPVMETRYQGRQSDGSDRVPVPTIVHHVKVRHTDGRAQTLTFEGGAPTERDILDQLGTEDRQEAVYELLTLWSSVKTAQEYAVAQGQPVLAARLTALQTILWNRIGNLA